MTDIKALAEMDIKALADRHTKSKAWSNHCICGNKWPCIDARILRDVHEWHQNVKAFGLHSKSAMGTAHRLEAVLDALEKDDD